jgi:hypothetical protein
LIVEVSESVVSQKELIITMYQGQSFITAKERDVSGKDKVEIYSSENTKQLTLKNVRK